jgi:hypothetical protein
MEYLIIGYPHGNGRMLDYAKVEAQSSSEALKKIHKSIWYNYHAIPFSLEKYNELKNERNNELSVRL